MSSELKNAPSAQPTSETELQCALHEVSNALTVVLGWLDVAMSQVGAADSSARAGQGLAQAVAVAQSHAQRAHRVARSAIGAKPHASPAHYRESLLQLALEAARPTAQRKGVSLETFSAEDPEADLDVSHKLNIRVDEQGEVLQILLNLLLNAIAFTPSAGSVRVSVREKDQHAIWTVSDDGPGVPAAVRTELFGNRTSLRPGGAGIGLYHSMELAVRRGGSVRLLPARAGEGATFELVWPKGKSADVSNAVPVRSVAPTKAGAPQQPPRAQQRQGQGFEGQGLEGQGLEGLRVLVLEDDPAVSEMLEFGLESKGVVVTCARDIKDFNAALETKAAFDAALLDYSPIQADPDKAMATLKSSQGDMPVILISGSVIAPQTTLPIKLWVQKPFELSEVYDALRVTLSTPIYATTTCTRALQPSGEQSSVRATASSTMKDGECAAG